MTGSPRCTRHLSPGLIQQAAKTSNPYKDCNIVAGWTLRWDPVPRRCAPSCAGW
jgi:hypothetical protein